MDKNHKEHCRRKNNKCKKLGHLEVAFWKGKSKKFDKNDKRAKKVGQVKEKSESECSSESEDSSNSSSLSSNTSIYHIREVKGRKSNGFKAIFELQDEGEH